MARALRNGRGSAAVAVENPIRCAIYTRKSTDEGLDRDFNSLDNQREAAENYIRSQRGDGWEVLSDRYDDGGFSGGNMERPALLRLLNDIQNNCVDCVIIYKLDRLSRSMRDFFKIFEVLEQNNVAFVSVTQAFNTTTPVGRMTMNILLSFAQFEREVIAERTRDKVWAARRRGKWTGGTPRLGYDVAPEGGRLLVNKEEAEQVRAIYALYAESSSLLAGATELNRRGWRRKSWKTKDGRWRKGKEWDVANLRRLLTDPTHIGKAKFGEQVVTGEHDGIVPKRVFEKVQAIMQENRRTGGAAARNTHGALLRGLLRCMDCDAGMVHGCTRKKGRLYRYYVCSKAQKRGWKTCPTKSVSAARVEDFVVDQIRAIGRDPEVRRETFRQALSRVAAQRRGLKLEAKHLTKDAARTRSEVDRLVQSVAKASGEAGQALLDALAKARDRLGTLDRRLPEIYRQEEDLDALRFDEDDLGRTLERFDPIWEVLLTPEKERILRLLIDRIDYDGTTETMSFAFRLPGLAELASEIGAGDKAS